MKTRFIVMLFLALLMLTVLAACGEKEGTFPGGMSNVTTGTPTVGTQPGTQDTTAPTTQAPTQGATESTTPPATEPTTPPATEPTTPPATEPTTPPATEPTTPPATEPTTPPTTTPPTTTPPTTTPPATEAPHAHNFISTVTTAATCGKDGVRTYSCSCGDTYTEKIAATGQHAWGEWSNVKEPTCTAPGFAAGKACKYCNTVSEETLSLEPTGHKPVEVKGFSPTAFSPGLTVGQKCETCQEVLVEQEVIPAGAPGYITSKPIVITTEHLAFHIPAGVFVPNNLVENANIITNAIETVTGLRFEGNPEYGGGKVPVNISRYSGDPNSESGSAYTYYGSVYMCPVDLIDYMVLIHECSHVIEGRQHGWSYEQIATEGISTYTEYKVRAYIAQNYPDLLQYTRVPEYTFYNYELSYDALYAHPVEYWFENKMTDAESSNANYSIGLRFMRYLETVYGSYTKWFLDYQQYNPYKSELYGGQMLPVEEQLKAFKIAYGNDVFDNFYPWLRQNEDWFADPSRTGKLLDLTALKEVNPYPVWTSDTFHDCELAGFCFRVEYEDLSVGLDALRYYIETYKGKSADGLCLKTCFEGTLYFYDANGNLLREETSPSAWEWMEFDLSGVSTIKLGGKVKVWGFQLVGF